MNEEPENPKSPFKDWRVRGLILTAAVVGFLIGMVFFGAPWHLPPAWGDVPTWLLAVGAAATAWIALLQLSDLRRQIAGEITRNQKRDRLLDKQLAEAEARESFERRRQAEDVNVGYIGMTTGRVENNSPRPISDVTCKVMSKTGGHCLAVPAGSGELVQTPLGPMFIPGAKPIDRVEALRPTAVAGFTFPEMAPKRGEDKDVYDEGEPDERRSPDQVLVAWFTDDAGFRWQLDEDQHLLQSNDETTYLARPLPQSRPEAIDGAAIRASAAPQELS